MRRNGDQRLVALFASVEKDAERLVALVEEERRLLDRLEEVSQQKACIVAELADSARAAALADVKSILANARRRPPHTILP
jgi:uncharacterized protein YlxW (UPF0749 family)